MNVHFIAIGGSAMHNLAIALHKKGYRVTGSDDEITDPSLTRLQKYGLLPGSMGWDVSRIHPGLDAVILGMHARADNPELARARDLGLKIFSYPEYLYEQSKEKIRVVIGGSHGKTTITAMILHVLQHCEIEADYMVGAQLEGFEVMVKLSEGSKYMILEGDEYLTSPIDRRPKFHVYRPDIALLSGIAWDHINVFPTFEEYVEQFRIFIRMVPPGGTLIWCGEDEELRKICRERTDIRNLPYSFPVYRLEKGITTILFEDKSYPLKVFGRHNLLNLEGSRLVCEQMGVTPLQFYEAIQTFGGASRRLERVSGNREMSVFRDFAHSPSKVKATIQAVKSQYPGRKLIACLELHTFSSLSRVFLPHYLGTMDEADVAIVYFNPHAVQLKKLPEVDPEEILRGFGKAGLEVFSDSALLKERLQKEDWKNKNLLLMSSGNFDGMEFKA
ncbi:MAG TPA: Mur ligase family protein [Bacteroidales bacterium]|nr:Mur ligase family protein [Bacteroidales bacterium]